MILVCPACAKRYLIPDSAIGPDGRQVRCAACRHSWFEAPAPLDAMPPLPRQFTQSAPAAVEPVAAPSAPAAPPAPPFAFTPRVDPAPPASVTPPDEPAIDRDPFAPEPPFRARRNRSRRWTIAAMLASLLLLGGVVAVYYFASPNLLARLGINIVEPDTPLKVQFTQDVGPKDGMPQAPRYVALRGKVLNPTPKAQRVPDLLAELVDDHGRVVYSLPITPKSRTVAANGSVDFEDVVPNIPNSARDVHISFLDANPL